MDHQRQAADLAALTMALNNKTHWLVAVDDLHANQRLRREALKYDWVLDPAYLYGNVEFVNPLTLSSTPFCYMAVPKSRLSREGILAFLGGESSEACEEKDLFLDGRDIPLLVEIIDRVRHGGVTLPGDVGSN